MAEPSSCDVAVIGAGVVGAAIARALARFELEVALVEAGSDVGAGTSKANTALLHTGFDAQPGSLESRLLADSYPKMLAYAEAAGIPLEKTGAILVAWTDEQVAALPAIREKAEKNGVRDLVPLSADQVYAREPNLGPLALAGLLIPGESIICPYTPPIAFATDAVSNGARLFLDSPVHTIQKDSDSYVLVGGKQEIRCRWVINAAGLHSDAVDRLFGHARFTVKPRRGELIVYDKLARTLLEHVILPVPTKTTKGVLVSPTVFGNVLLGPTAEDLEDKTDTSTTERGLLGLIEKGRQIMPRLVEEEVTATYAGLRAATEHSDYQIELDAPGRYVVAGGIRSTGLSASLGIADHIVALLASAGVELRPKSSWKSTKMPPIGEKQIRPHQSAEMIAEKQDYGRIVCHCERVTRGEIMDALCSKVPATSLDGLRRRTRCLQGRCQGFYCLAEVAAIASSFAEKPIGAFFALEGES